MSGRLRVLWGPADGWKTLMKLKFELIEVFRWVDDKLLIKKKTDLH